MECHEAIAGRRSHRRFAAEAIAPDLLTSLLAAAAAAPMAGNRHDRRFLVLRNAELLARMERTVHEHAASLSGAAAFLADYCRNATHLRSAPVVVAILVQRLGKAESAILGDRAEIVDGGLASAAMAAQNLLLAATAAGLGGCCLSAPLLAGAALEELLGVDRRSRLVGLVTLGRPTDTVESPPRPPLERIVEWR